MGAYYETEREVERPCGREGFSLSTVSSSSGGVTPMTMVLFGGRSRGRGGWGGLTFFHQDVWLLRVTEQQGGGCWVRVPIAPGTR